MDRIVLNVAMGPHVHDGSHVSKIMNGYLIALVPAAVWGCVLYGLPGLRMLLLAAGSALVFEWLSRMAMGRPSSLADGSVLVQGLLFGMMLPSNSPWWLIVVGAFLVVVIGKQLFGGIGGYPFNPVLVGYAILSVSWPLRLSSHFTLADTPLKSMTIEPLVALKTYGASAVGAYEFSDLFLGYQAGGLGTGSTLLILLGGLYLLVRGFAPWRVVVSYIVSIFVFGWIFQLADASTYAGPMFHLMSGMTMFGAFFLVCDFTTCPVNGLARVIYGAGAGLLIILIRNFGVYPDGTVFAVLLMNLFHPLIDRITKPVIGLEQSMARLGEE